MKMKRFSIALVLIVSAQSCLAPAASSRQLVESVVRNDYQRFSFGIKKHGHLATYPHYGSFEKASSTYGIPVELLIAVAKWESNFGNVVNCNKNGTSDHGFMQINWPDTAKELGFTAKDQLYDIPRNIDAGARYLYQLLRVYNGDVFLSVCAYNHGPGVIKSRGKVPVKALGYAAGVYRALQSVTRSPFRSGVRQVVLNKEFRFFTYAESLVKRIQKERKDLPVEISKKGRGRDITFTIVLECSSDVLCDQYCEAIEEATGFNLCH